MADTTTLPVITQSVDQRWFIEPLNGPTPPGDFLDRFPEEVYSKSVDSHLVRFMYSLLGPAGIGWLKKNLLDARVILEERGVELFDIERYYSDPFAFGRILGELYDVDPTGLLSRSDWDKIKAQDEGYRTRAIDYLKGVRLGNSPAGMTLVARSGLGFPVEIIENYRYLFDQHSDAPLGLLYYGSTTSTEEFVVVPQQDVSRSEVHQVSFSGNPTTGNFAISLGGRVSAPASFDVPAGEVAYAELGDDGGGRPCMRIFGPTPPGQPVLGSIMGYTVRPNPAGSPISIAFDLNTYDPVTATFATTTPETYGPHISTDILSFVNDINTNSTQFAAVFLRNGTITGSAIAAGASTIGFTGRGLQSIIEQLPNVGPGNVRVTGGPGPLNPYVITFTGNLSNQALPELTVLSTLSGGSADANQITNALDPSTEVVTISEEAQHNLQVALDNVKPITGIPTVFDGQGVRMPQPWNTVAASSEYQEVLRFVTGNPSVSWPAVDTKHWIENFKEKEAPRVKDDRQHHYVGFHNIFSTTAYTDDALTDPSYATDSSVLSQYNSEHVGPFAPQQNVIPFFRQYQNSVALVFTADRAPADYAEPLTITTQDSSSTTSFINGIYPADYVSLPSIPQIKYKDEQFWASRERLPGEADLLEIDLGSVQAVNYLTFEMIGKPVSIEITVDRLDQAPRRGFTPVIPDTYAPFPLSLTYDPLSQNPWRALEYRFTDSLGEVPLTRFLRIKIARQNPAVDSTNPPFLYNSITQVQTPWSVEIRNLRIGRNVVG